MLAVSLYRPPSSTQRENLLLDDFLEGVSIGKEVLILRDFYLLTLSCPFESSLDSYIFLLEYGLSQWVEFSSFFLSGNIVDFFLTSEQDRIRKTFTRPPLPGWHHYPLLGNIFF